MVYTVYTMTRVSYVTTSSHAVKHVGVHLEVYVQLNYCLYFLEERLENIL